MQGVFPALVLQRQVGEGHVADHPVDFGQAGVLEILDADVGVRVERAGDPPGNGVYLDADEAHVLRREERKTPRAAARLQHQAVVRHAQARERPNMALMTGEEV